MSRTDIDWDRIRSDFLHDPEQTYLNTGSWGVMARPVFDAYTTALRELENNPTRNRAPLREKLQRSRSLFSSHLNIQAEDIAFLPNVTAAINMVVNGLDWEEGDEVVTTDQEYGAILNCLDNASNRWGVKIVTAKVPVPPKSADEVLDPIVASITSQTKLIVCSHITTRTGMILPIREIAAAAHVRGVLVAIDGAHAPGMIPLDLTDADVDFYGGNCHKWLCSPKGVGFLFAKPSVQANLHHLVVSWGYNTKGHITGNTGPTINDAPSMWGLENWGTTDWAAQSAVGDAIAYQQSIGIDVITARVRELAGYVRSCVQSEDWIQVLTPTVEGMFGALTTVRLEGLGGRDLAKWLYQDKRITIPVFEEGDDCSIRVSTHIYNSEAEVDYLLSSIRAFR